MATDIRSGIYYKVLAEDGSCYHGGRGTWFLARGKHKGKWMPRIEGELKLCATGYHILKREHLIYWLGPAIHRVEAEEPVLWDDGKGVTHRARDLGRIEAWNERTQRLFAADCAERVLPFWENVHPMDERPRQAIEVSRRFAKGEATRKELVSAAYAASHAAAAAYAAAAAAAHAAAHAAASPAAAAHAAASPAAAAYAAAAAAAAHADERQWQTERLFDYLEGRV